ncbi:MAG: FAD-binding oxidoreductase, partial [Paracoccaceae bacterium]|nr:FAD-binding oxidoreductase [Paracoccaceae bacterium]
MSRIPGFVSTPGQGHYDVIIVGAAMTGSAVAHFLAAHPGFDGRVLVIERDPGYEFASTSHSNSCLRLQFSSEINVRISQFTADYIRDFPASIGDEDAPQIDRQVFGYMYLAATEAQEKVLRENRQVQNALGVPTQILSAEEIARDHPFYALDDIRCGSINLQDEGYFDGATMGQWWRKKARVRGVEFLAGEVTGVEMAGGRVTGVRLADGSVLGCGVLVNAAGPRAALLAGMAGLDLPVEPR